MLSYKYWPQRVLQYLLGDTMWKNVSLVDGHPSGIHSWSCWCLASLHLPLKKSMVSRFLLRLSKVALTIAKTMQRTVRVTIFIVSRLRRLYSLFSASRVIIRLYILWFNSPPDCRLSLYTHVLFAFARDMPKCPCVCMMPPSACSPVLTIVARYFPRGKIYN